MAVLLRLPIKYHNIEFYYCTEIWNQQNIMQTQLYNNSNNEDPPKPCKQIKHFYDKQTIKARKKMVKCAKFPGAPKNNQFT